MIQIEHVSKTFSGKYGTVHALDDVSIHVEKGDICGIIGFSGAGKSTLIRLVNGLETADSETYGNKKRIAEAIPFSSCLTRIRTRTGRTKNCSATITP